MSRAFLVLVGLIAGCSGGGGTGLITLERLEVVEDDNADGVLNPGEQAGLAVTLYNAGSGDVDSAKLTLTTTAAGVTVDTASTYCGSVSSAGIASCSGVDVTVGPDVVPGTEVVFDGVVTSADPGEWTFQVVLSVLATGAAPAVHAVSVLSDSNGDFTLNPGESADLRLTVVNGGTSEINGLRVTIAAQNPEVTVTGSGDTYCGDIAPGSTATCQAIGIEVSASAVPGTSLIFDAVFDDALSTSWDQAFAVPLKATGAAPFILDVDVNQDTNGDGVLNPGETAELRFLLGNSGTSSAESVKHTLSSQSSALTVDSGTNSVYCGQLDPGSETWCSADTVTVASDAATSHVLLDLAVVDAQGALWPLTILMPVLTPPSLPEVVDAEATAKGSNLVDVQVTLRNAGLSTLVGPRVMLEAAPGGVTITSPNAAYRTGELKPKATTKCSAVVIETEQSGTVSFSLRVTDELGQSWSMPVQVPLP
jgi:hypothetical protein